MKRDNKSILTQVRAIRAEFAEDLTPRRTFAALSKRVRRRLNRIEAILLRQHEPFDDEPYMEPARVE